MESVQTIIKTLLKNPTQIKSKSQAKQIHAHIVKSFPIFTTTLLSIYSKLNLLPESLILFNTLPSPPILAWKSIIKCYSSTACFSESLNCFVKMRALGIYPDHNVFPSVLKSCTHLMYFKFGESVHACIIRVGLEFDIFTGNALLSMYSKLQRSSALQVFDESPERTTSDQNESILVSNNNNNKELDLQMQSVRKVFETMEDRDVVSYNTLILGYAQNNMYNEAMLMIKDMSNANLKPDAFTLSNLLPVVAKHMDVWKGKEIHGYGVRHGFDQNEFITTGLSDMYANCNMVQDSYHLFSSLPKKDIVSWCSIISKHVQNGLFDEGLNLFRQMLTSNIKPVPISISSITPACAHLTTLPLGQQLHGYIIRNHFDKNIFISSSLVHMYAKCGNIKLAKKIFYQMNHHDLVSWTSMIMGCALHGHVHDSITLFQQMETELIRPNSVAFLAVLTACSHGGMVDEGLKFYEKMVKDYKLIPEFEHYACVVDLLGRAGELEAAFGFIKSLPENKRGGLWLPLLAACRVHKNVELGEKIEGYLWEFDDDEEKGAYVLLSNMYFDVGRYEEAGKVRGMMGKKMNGKEPGCSWIGIGNKVHAFISGDGFHSDYDGVIEALDILLQHMEKEGYVADMTCI
ncbi:unnamed protein product [Lactuca saligna]|uniref:Pentatricopeptide repeat-containing protein n=1 Tax=Lactuca saligna TaxID=75948 RepID=A0AA35YPL4_LACSI|nr:unnamed protein product [Lactuca saligna]